MRLGYSFLSTCRASPGLCKGKQGTPRAARTTELGQPAEFAAGQGAVGPGRGGGGRPGAGQLRRSLPCGRVPAGPADVAGRDPGLPRALGRPSGKSPGRPLPIPFLGGRGPERRDPCTLRVVRSHRRRKVPRKQLAWGRRSGEARPRALRGCGRVSVCV